MTQETIFRTLFIISGIAMFAIRIYYQSKVLRNQDKVEIKQKGFVPPPLGKSFHSEEQVMIAQFGEQYEAYIAQTGRFIPKR